MPLELRNAALQVYNNRKKSLPNTYLTHTSLRLFPDETVESNEAACKGTQQLAQPQGGTNTLLTALV